MTTTFEDQLLRELLRRDFKKRQMKLLLIMIFMIWRTDRGDGAIQVPPEFVPRHIQEFQTLLEAKVLISAEQSGQFLINPDLTAWQVTPSRAFPPDDEGLHELLRMNREANAPKINLTGKNKSQETDHMFREIVRRDFSKRHLKMLLMVLALSNPSAIIPKRGYFCYSGLHDQHVSKELQHLLSMQVLVMNSNMNLYQVNPDLTAWQVTPERSWAAEDYDAILALNQVKPDAQKDSGEKEPTEKSSLPTEKTQAAEDLLLR